ncbi:glycosyltransferase [Actinoplanes sp. NPDC051633]|uniref:glycosyltransferase n=1 Tax=Actinoplanes sp. NPDC051633 TaxID=3155670 RepID=UPI003419AB14
MSQPLVAAVLIVKDEAAMLPACLASLARVVDEIVVHDTGSTDGTDELAAGLGATVTRGAWTGDFAAARNAAAAAARADWVLALDADHRVTADPVALRARLTGTDADAFRIQVDDAHYASPYRQPETRLYRPAALSWTGRVHERLVPAAARGELPASVVRLQHLGHHNRPELLRRAERNLELGRVMLDELARGSDREAIARTMLALGRDCVAAESWQQAADTFETLRDLFPGSAEWTQATDCLARLVLARGYDKICLVLVGQLRDAGAPEPYCDWLEAQALAHLGGSDEAARLLAGVTEVVDTAGRRRDPAALLEMKALVGRLRSLTVADR